MAPRPSLGVHGAVQDDRRGFRVFEQLGQEHAAHEDALRDVRTLARVALVYSLRTQDFYGRDEPEARYLAHFRGAYLALLRARIPFDVLEARQAGPVSPGPLPGRRAAQRRVSHRRSGGGARCVPHRWRRRGGHVRDLAPRRVGRPTARLSVGRDPGHPLGGRRTLRAGRAARQRLRAPGRRPPGARARATRAGGDGRAGSRRLPLPGGPAGGRGVAAALRAALDRRAAGVRVPATRPVRCDAIVQG